MTGAIALLLFAMGVGQAQPIVIGPGTSYTIQFLHDGQRDPQFRLWIDGQIVKNYTSAEVTKSAQPDANGQYTYAVPGLPIAKGAHTLMLSAVNAAGETKSDPLGVSGDWATAPAKPGSLLIIKVTVQTQGGGGLTESE